METSHLAYMSCFDLLQSFITLLSGKKTNEAQNDKDLSAFTWLVAIFRVFRQNLISECVF